MSDPTTQLNSTKGPSNVAIDYARERYIEEQSRFTHLEEKCSKFLTMLTAAIGLFSLLAGDYVSSNTRPDGFLGWATFSALFITFLALASAWGHVLAALKPRAVHVAAKSIEALTFIEEQKAEKRDSFILKCYRETIAKLGIDMQDKEKSLKIAYNYIVATGVSFSISLALILLNQWWL